MSDDYSATTATTGRLTVGSSVDGFIDLDDSDWFAVTLSAGTTYQFALEGWQTLRHDWALGKTFLTLRDSTGQRLASFRDTSDFGRHTALITYTPTISGTYYLDAQSSGYGYALSFSAGTVFSDLAGIYRLWAGVDDYGKTTNTTGRLTVGSSVAGNIEVVGDSDWFAVTLSAGTTYTFNLEGSDTSQGTWVDPYLELYSSVGWWVANDNDSGTGLNSLIRYTPTTSGTYYLAAGEIGIPGTGTYHLFVDTAGGTLTGDAGSNNLTGTSGSDNFLGMAGNDRLTGGPGRDFLDGGEGIDTAIYSGNHSDYRLTRTGNTLVVEAQGGADGLDTLSQVERLQFADTKLAFDLDGNAGMVAKILGAAFGANAVHNKQFVGIGLSFLDGGMTYEELNALAIGAAGATTQQQVVDLLYTNVVGVAPSPAAAQPFIDMLNNGMTVGALGVLAADTSINKANIDLVGLQMSGIEYL